MVENYRPRSNPFGYGYGDDRAPEDEARQPRPKPGPILADPGKDDAAHCGYTVVSRRPWAESSGLLSGSRLRAADADAIDGYNASADDDMPMPVIGWPD